MVVWYCLINEALLHWTTVNRGKGSEGTRKKTCLISCHLGMPCDFSYRKLYLQTGKNYKATGKRSERIPTFHFFVFHRVLEGELRGCGNWGWTALPARQRKQNDRTTCLSVLRYGYCALWDAIFIMWLSTDRWLSALPSKINVLSHHKVSWHPKRGDLNSAWLASATKYLLELVLSLYFGMYSEAPTPLHWLVQCHWPSSLLHSRDIF